MLLSRLSLVVVAMLASACTTSQPAPFVHDDSRRVGMSLAQASALVRTFEAKQVAPQKRLPAPSSMDEAQAALKADRIDGFPDAVAYLVGQPGHDAAALKAQVMLAWGEAELTVAEVLSNTADQLDESVRALQMKKNTPDVAKQLNSERGRVQLYRDTDEALRMLAAEHVAAGVADAQRLINEEPDDYVGYRIAADAHRLRDEWREFSAMLGKVEDKNPDSNGLVFLRGVAAQFRDNDPAEAVKLFRLALSRDPQFVRAQAQLVLVTDGIFAQHAELLNLRALAPDHQIVRWAGPGIDEAYTKAVERQALLQKVGGIDRTPPGAKP